jgi:hypothetical protein
MPHDAALFAESVKPGRTPEETAADFAADIADIRTEHTDDDDQTETDYRRLTGQGGGVTLDSIAPTGGVANAVVVATGGGFVPTSKLKSGATVLTTTYVNSTTLSAPVPGPPGAKNITVDNGYGDVSNIKVYTVSALAGDAPTASNTKAEIIEWLLANGAVQDEPTLTALTKTELLDLVQDLLDN